VAVRGSWVMLAYRMPREPSTPRIVVWRRLRHLGVAQPVDEYLLAVTGNTREHPAVELGASPRAALGLFRASQALAAIGGREYVKPDDVKRLLGPTFRHRLIVRPEAEVAGQNADIVLESIIAQVTPPR